MLNKKKIHRKRKLRTNTTGPLVIFMMCSQCVISDNRLIWAFISYSSRCTKILLPSSDGNNMYGNVTCFFSVIQTCLKTVHFVKILHRSKQPEQRYYIAIEKVIFFDPERNLGQLCNNFMPNCQQITTSELCNKLMPTI